MKAVITLLLLFLALGCAGKQPASEEVQAELRRAIVNANIAMTRAARANDATVLTQHISGELLESLSRSIEKSKERGTYAVSELQDLRWGDMRVRGNSAEVVATERWRHTHYAVGTDKCVMILPPRDIRQTYHLEKGSRGWVITKSVDDPKNQPPRPRPCPS